MRVPASRKKSLLKTTGMKLSSGKKTDSITIEDIFKTVDTAKQAK